jgi:hypothetical protein
MNSDQFVAAEGATSIETDSDRAKAIFKEPLIAYAA